MFFVTGANGFLGRALIAELAKRNYSIRGSARSGETVLTSQVELVQSPHLNDETSWIDLFKGCQYLIHTAGRVHMMNDQSMSSLELYRKINTNATLNLARQASIAGVKRFVYISTIKVNGEMTRNGEPFTNSSLPNPKDPYATSKWEAEEGLKKISAETGLEFVILRPPLIYGIGVKGNFRRLIKSVQNQIPLPLLSIKNQRSLIGLGNCVDAIICASQHPNAAGKVFLISDDEDLTIPDLVKKISRSFSKTPLLFPMPTYLLNRGASLFGKSAALDRLVSSLQIDNYETKKILNWQPPFSVDDELEKIATSLFIER